MILATACAHLALLKIHKLLPLFGVFFTGDDLMSCSLRGRCRSPRHQSSGGLSCREEDALCPWDIVYQALYRLSVSLSRIEGDTL